MIHRWLVIGGMVSMGCASVAGADDNVSASVRVEVQMVSVSVPDARLLVPQLQDAKTAQRTFERVQEMIAQDKATLLGWPIVWIWCTDGEKQRSVCESVHEFRYPTEFQPARPIVHPPDPFAGVGAGLNWAPIIPTAFETRPIDATLEVEASVEDGGRTVEVALVSQFIRFLELKSYRIHPVVWGIGGATQQPDLATSKVTSGFRVPNDRPMLAGVFVMNHPQPHVELFILRARANVLPRNAVVPASSSPP